MGLVRQDSISYGMSALSVILLLFLATFNKDILILATFVVTIIIASLVISEKFGIQPEDTDISDAESKEILLWSFGSFIAIYLLNIFAEALPLSQLSELLAGESVQSATIILGSLSILIAVAEEQFFRSFILNLTTQNIEFQIVGPLVSGFIFMLYHFAVYGTSFQSLFIVFGAGAILAAGAIRTRRVSPFIIAHVLNNLFSVIS